MAVLTMTKILNELREHYAEILGKPTGGATLRRGNRTVEIVKWSAEATREGVAFYATIGASATTLPSSSRHRIEFFVGLLPEKDDVMEPLASLALYPTERQVTLDHGHTVPTGGPVWPGTDMARFLILRQRETVLPTFEDGINHIEFLQVIPIFESEFAYKSQHGADDLVRHWQRCQVQFWNPNRVPEPGSSPTSAFAHS